METFKCKSALNNKSKLAKAIQKVINLKTATTRITSNNGIGVCLLTSQNKLEKKDVTLNNHKHKNGEAKVKHNRAVMEAVVAKLFAGITSIKAAYAELQMAQNPYNSDAIQVADQAVVDELKVISELKRSFMKKELHISPQVTLMLAEIQEQQSLMKTYEITMKKLEGEVEVKETDVSSLKQFLDECFLVNKVLEKRLNVSGPLFLFDNIQFSTLNMGHFVQFLHYTLRSLRSFVKLMIREMESAKWDLDEAAKVIEPDTILVESDHICYVFESFVCKTMFEGFNFPDFLSLPQDKLLLQSDQYFIYFKKIKSLNPKQCVSQNPNSSFAKFTRAKYVQLVHAKMECSLFGNLNQRKLVNSGGCPDSAFFTAFVEMAKRVWLLHCLAFSFGEEIAIFQVKKHCRFSEVYMENVSDDESLFSSENVDLRVGFTVVPGFKIGKTVIQSQVYLSPVITPPSC